MRMCGVASEDWRHAPGLLVGPGVKTWDCQDPIADLVGSTSLFELPMHYTDL